MEGWESFFLGQLGASAALGGLLFVAISINVDRLIAFPELPNRAFLALLLLVSVLVVSSLALVPGQPLALFGAEVLVLGAALTAGGTAIEVAAARAPDNRRRVIFAANAFLFAAAAAPYAVGGLLLLAGRDSGIYFVAAAIIFCFVKAVLDAWVLLVEIKR